MKRVFVRLLLALVKRIDPCVLGHEWTDDGGFWVQWECRCARCGVYRYPNMRRERSVS